MDSACALVTFGQGIAPVSRVLGVSRAQLTLRMKASDNKPDKRRPRRDRLRMQKSYHASWISLAICQHTGIAVSGRYSGGSPEMKDYRS